MNNPNLQKAIASVYKIGMKDAEVAFLCGCVPRTVQKWRGRNGFTKHNDFSDLHNRIEKYYEQGLSDVAVAARCYCSKYTVLRWRKRNNKLPNKVSKKAD